MNGKNKVEWPGVEMKPLDKENFKYIYKADLAALGEVDDGDIRVIFNDGKDIKSTQLQAYNNIAVSCENSRFYYDENNYEEGIFTSYGEFDESKIVESKMEYVVGDVTNDGEITSEDALKILRYSVRLEYVYDEATYYASLVDDDDEITSTDALIVLRKSAGLDAGDKVGSKREYIEYDYQPD